MMKSLGLTLLALSMIFGLTSAVESSAISLATIKVEGAEKPQFRQDRVLVQMKSSSSMLKTAYAFQKSADATGLSFERTIAIEPESADGATGTAYGLMTLDTSTDNVESAIARLENHPDVEIAQPDFIYYTSAVPNDPDYGLQWGLKNTGQTIPMLHSSQSLYTTANPGTSGNDLGLETHWDTVTDCSSVIVAVIDTGVDLDHDDLKDNLWTNASLEHGYDFVNDDTDPSDDSGHGTHVAGTIGARGNNGIGGTGVCWRVQLMALKVFGATGSASSADLIGAVNFARVNGAHIINMSLGGSGFDQMFFNAIKTASDAGILSVVAAGNDNRSNNSYPVYPCNYEITNVICVGAVDQSFGRASFSNYSTTYVDIAAPGTNIVSTMYHDFGALINVPLTVGTWTRNSANFDFNGGYLQNPATWDGVAVNYVNNASDTAYTSVNLGGTIGANLIVDIRGASQSATDYFSVWEKGAGGDATTGTKLYQVSGSTSGALVSVPWELSSCVGSATCSVGFKFTSNATTTGIGFRVEGLNVEPLVASTTGLDSYNGTSMATPHIAGVAALIKASNPAFTATDIKNSILTTGTSVPALATYIKSSSVANPVEAAKYVDPPLGVGAAVVP